MSYNYLIGTLSELLECGQTKREQWYYQNSLVYGGKEGDLPHIIKLMKKLSIKNSNV
jgi:hypothetical protein